MFQTFDDPAPRQASASLQTLRDALKRHSLDGFIVPKTDEFQNEYVPAYSDRLFWLTGFTGSAGTAVVWEQAAVLLVDSRYLLQARSQVEPGAFEIEDIAALSVEGCLARHTAEGLRIGYDPRLHAFESVRKMERLAAERGFELVGVESNPIDELWLDRPGVRSASAFGHDLRYAGESAEAKIARILSQFAEKGVDAAFIATPESVAWLFNIRGGDVEHTPLVMCRAWLSAKQKPTLFIEPHKLSVELHRKLEQVAEISPLGAEHQTLRSCSAGARIWIDPARTPASFIAPLTEARAQIVEAADPCLLAKSVKNSTELEGARAAHLRDGVALCRFLAWLDRAVAEGAVDEIGAAEKLEDFRRQNNALRDISFDTISGAGDHGAIVHYRVTRSTNQPLRPGTLYLTDSGAHYADGTTDVTRTVAVGAPAPEMQRHFTLVLKAHIAVATARFPPGTRGVDLDPLARAPLWRHGLDYGHGTGHGVGSYLSVHEGPQSISRTGLAVLQPGMILSIEPGLYIEGAYGIRIENLAIVKPPEPVPGGSTEMMTFETLTLAPIDRRLIDADLLSQDERGWLDAYHARVAQDIGPQLDADDRAWLEAATVPLFQQANHAS